MSFDIKTPELLAISGLLFCAVITVNSQYQFILIFYLFFIPLIRPELVKTAFANSLNGKFFGIPSFWLILLSSAAILYIFLFIPRHISFGLTTLLLVALPEEWFFRGYLQRSLGNNMFSILIVSLLFSITHGLTISWNMAALVFIPSLFFGYVYWKSGSLALVILLHTLANFMPRLLNSN